MKRWHKHTQLEEVHVAKLPKSERDAISNEVREERKPFRPSSQNRFMEPNLEQLYRDEATAGNLRAKGHISHRLCIPVDYDKVRSEGI